MRIYYVQWLLLSFSAMTLLVGSSDP